MSIAVSHGEVILTGGQGTRFELGPLSESREELLRLVRSISHGKLSERIRPGSVSYELQMDDGSVLRGRSSSRVLPGISHGETIHYGPYTQA